MTKKFVLIIVSAGLFATSPVLAQQTKPVGISSKSADDCKPIGRTQDGKLVYSMKCEYIPAPLTPPVADKGTTVVPQQQAQQPDSEVAEAKEGKGGLFKFPFNSSFGINSTPQTPGVGPAGSR